MARHQPPPPHPASTHTRLLRRATQRLRAARVLAWLTASCGCEPAAAALLAAAGAPLSDTAALLLRCHAGWAASNLCSRRARHRNAPTAARRTLRRRRRTQSSLDGTSSDGDGGAGAAGGRADPSSKSKRCSETDTLLALLSLQLGW